MKVSQISEHIWSVKLWLILPVHVWLVKERDGITLVDTGVPLMAKGIVETIHRLDVGPLRRVVLTHGHPDHIGGLARILQTCEAPVYAHRLEIPCMEGELPYREGKKPAAYVPKGLVRALDEDEHGRLQAVGSLTPYHTPGHSPGHVVYHHAQDRVLLAGDLVSSRRGRMRPPYFTPALREAVRSSAIVGELRPVRMEVCHGDAVFHPADQLESYLARHLKPEISKSG